MSKNVKRSPGLLIKNSPNTPSAFDKKLRIYPCIILLAIYANNQNLSFNSVLIANICIKTSLYHRFNNTNFRLALVLPTVTQLRIFLSPPPQEKVAKKRGEFHTEFTPCIKKVELLYRIHLFFLQINH